MIITVITMLLILSVLIFVHELGHFLAAKKFGIRVDEFAIGFPPKIWSFLKNGTNFAINLIPLGGYVKIHGEAIEDVDQYKKMSKESDSFVSKSKWQQIVVLLAGIAFNVLLAFILLTFSLLIPGKMIAPDPVPNNAIYEIIGTRQGSPAEISGLEIGDEVLNLSIVNKINNELILETNKPRTNLLRESIINTPKPTDLSVVLSVKNNQNIIKEIDLPVVFDEKSNDYYVGLGVEPMIVDNVNFFSAIKLGFNNTLFYTGAIFTGLISFIGGFFNDGGSSLSMLSGPIGLTEYVGEASKIGFAYLLEFMALISLNLAVLNLFPIPALDGGRVVFVLIEAITKKPIPPKVANIVNGTGFALLLLLMIVVSFFDVNKLI